MRQESMRETNISVIGNTSSAITFNHANKPHDINFLCKLPQHICTYALRLKNFDSHILTTICTSVPKGLQRNAQRENQLKGYVEFKHTSSKNNSQVTKWPRANFVFIFQLVGINLPDISSIRWYLNAMRGGFHPCLVLFIGSIMYTLIWHILLLQRK